MSILDEDGRVLHYIDVEIRVFGPPLRSGMSRRAVCTDQVLFSFFASGVYVIEVDCEGDIGRTSFVVEEESNIA